MKRTLIRFAVCVWIAGTIHSLASAAVLQGLGDLPGGRFHSVAAGVSADGNVVVGLGNVSGGVVNFRWVRGEGMQRITGLSDDAGTTSVCAVSGDGSTLVGDGHRSCPQAFRFTSAEGLRWLDESSTDDRFSRAYAASADGSVVVGRRADSTQRVEAFRWTSTEGSVGLGDLPGGDFFSVAFATNVDGGVVVGAGLTANGREGFRWTLREGMVGLGDLPGGDRRSEARAVSADGQVIIGQSSSASGSEAFRWTRTGGMVGLGDLPGGRFESTALAVSADGSVIVGSSDSKDGTEAFIWTAATGMRSLRTVLYQLGSDVAGWELLEAKGLSSDGNVIVGRGKNASGRWEAWLADLDSDAAPTTDAPASFARRIVFAPIVAISLIAGVAGIGGVAAWRWLRCGESAPVA